MLRSFRWPPGAGGAAALWALLLLTGCDLWRRGYPDERREVNYMAAYNYALQGSYDEAVAAYNRALEANPNNATAHLDLGFLYQNTLHDYVVAIYHFRRCQEIRKLRHDREAEDPTLENAIHQGQIQLAIQFASAFGHQQTQTQVDDLKRRNAELEATIKELKLHLAQPNQPAESFAPPPIDPGAKSVSPPAGRPVQGGIGVAPRKETPPVLPAPESVPRANSGSRAEPPAATPRVHVVKSGESLAAIARRYGVTTQQILAANRGVDPRKLKPGQTVVIPDRR